jgi:hypothetical protein
VVVAPHGRSAFVALYGSSFPEFPSGGDVVRVSLRGRARVRPFATGFGIGQPLGLAMGPRALYVGLWESGRVVRFMLR